MTWKWYYLGYFRTLPQYLPASLTNTALKSVSLFEIISSHSERHTLIRLLESYVHEMDISL